MRPAHQLNIQIDLNKPSTVVISSIGVDSGEGNNETRDETESLGDELAPLPTWREWVMPIYDHELIRLIPLNIMMFCALFSYSCFRDCKDSIVKLSFVCYLFCSCVLISLLSMQ